MGPLEYMAFSSALLERDVTPLPGRQEKPMSEPTAPICYDPRADTATAYEAHLRFRVPAADGTDEVHHVCVTITVGFLKGLAQRAIASDDGYASIGVWDESTRDRGITVPARAQDFVRRD